ncbi:MAG TPA: tetratricopeptide repeat protein, partial [Polyangia bacterium]|nr:tetratricopeptide repeat protein [Polyangia bacterium]
SQGDDLRALLDAAIRDVMANDLASATPRVLEAARRFASGEPLTPPQALQLAQLASHVGALTIAERALARADRKTEHARDVAAAVATIRRQIGLPGSADKLGVAAEEEAAYVGAYREIALLAAAPDKRSIYQQRLHALAVRYPDVPGTKVLQCESDLRAGRFAAAEKQCRSAVSDDDEAVRGHYLLGVLLARSGRSTDAERELRSALMLDPDDSAVWRELTRLYEQTHNTIKLRQLDSERRALAAARQPQ